MSRGLIDADLGHGLLKKRIARSGAGKRGGFRVVVAHRQMGPWFFLEGYAKNEKSNLLMPELRARKEQGRWLLSMNVAELRRSIDRDDVMEVGCDAQTEIADS